MTDEQKWFRARRDFEAHSSQYLSGMEYKVLDHLPLDRWRAAGLIVTKGEPVPPQPRPVVVTVQRPVPITRRKGAKRITSDKPRVRVAEDHESLAHPDEARLTLCLGALAPEELRAMLDEALAIVEARR